MTAPAWPDRLATTPESIADVFDELAAESNWLAREMNEINASREFLNQANAARLIALGTRMKPAAMIRARLAKLEAADLQAGIDLWLTRRSAPEAESD